MSRAVNREAGIDGLRGIMLLIIVTTHYVPSEFFSGNIARPAAAVMLAVTGYFLMRTLERADLDSPSIATRFRSMLTMLWQRHMRVWPVVAGAVLLYVILGFVDPSKTTTQIHSTWPLYLGFMGNVVKMIYEENAFPAHFWLVSAQEQFILLLLLTTVFASGKNLKKLLVASIWIGVITRVVLCMIFMPDQPSVATETPFAIADALALGMLCRMAIGAKESKTKLRRNIIAAMLAVFFAWAIMPNTYFSYFGLTPLLAALIGCLIIITLGDNIRGKRFERAMLNWPFVVLLGQMSLSLFLIHPLVNTLLNLGYARLTGVIIPWWLLALLGPPLSVAAAFIYFRLVEVPIRRGRRKRQMRQEDDHVIAAAARPKTLTPTHAQ